MNPRANVFTSYESVVLIDVSMLLLSKRLWNCIEAQSVLLRSKWHAKETSNLPYHFELELFHCSEIRWNKTIVSLVVIV